MMVDGLLHKITNHDRSEDDHKIEDDHKMEDERVFEMVTELDEMRDGKLDISTYIRW